MVIPAVRIVVHDHDRRVLPIRRILKEVDDVHDELLLIERIGITGVTVLIACGFQEADGRESCRR